MSRNKKYQLSHIIRVLFHKIGSWYKVYFLLWVPVFTSLRNTGGRKLETNRHVMAVGSGPINLSRVRLGEGRPCREGGSKPSLDGSCCTSRLSNQAHWATSQGRTEPALRQTHTPALLEKSLSHRPNKDAHADCTDLPSVTVQGPTSLMLAIFTWKHR